jgi:hypothetical protein
LNPKFGVSTCIAGNGGMDVFNAGGGDDMIIINASNITALEQTGIGNRIGFACVCLTAWIGTPSTYNQIIQAVAVDITCARD